MKSVYDCTYFIMQPFAKLVKAGKENGSMYRCFEYLLKPQQHTTPIYYIDGLTVLNCIKGEGEVLIENFPSTLYEGNYRYLQSGTKVEIPKGATYIIYNNDYENDLVIQDTAYSTMLN